MPPRVLEFPGSDENGGAERRESHGSLHDFTPETDTEIMRHRIGQLLIGELYALGTPAFRGLAPL